MARLTSLFLVSTLFGAFGCNAIFGINDGKLADGGGNAGGGNTGAQNVGGANTGAGNQGGQTTGGGGNGGEGGGQVVFDPCDPSTFTDGDTSQEVGADCGIFVDPSNPTDGTGSKTDPFRSLIAAVDAHGAGVPIFIKGSPIITETVLMDRDGAIFGGLSGTWSRDKSKVPSIQATTGTQFTVPIIISVQGGNVLLDSLTLLGADVSAQEDSLSAGLFVIGSNVRIQDCRIEGGQGGFGHQGQSGTSGNGAAPGNGAPTGCSSALTGGGHLLCADGVDVSGGDGAKCSTSMGNVGMPGKGPNGGGAGGQETCTAGFPGPDGVAGNPGMRGPVFGGLTMNGIDNGSAPKAPDGVHGGGGGGGGARANANGGGGGSGGCGGTGGEGGGNGGPSFAIAALESSIDLVRTSLRASRAGSGGPGGPGGPGTSGAQGGFGIGSTGCAGGKGGNAGSGGNGAGGNGGVAALIAQLNGNVTSDSATKNMTELPAVPGQAGTGAGAGVDQAPNGLPGPICARFFSDGTGVPQCQNTLP